MYGLIGKMTAAPGKRDELAEILTGMRGMPGCHAYVVALDADDPDGLWITEVWDSADAHRASLSLPEVRDAIQRGQPLIVGSEHRIETIPLEGTLP